MGRPLYGDEPASYIRNSYSLGRILIINKRPLPIYCLTQKHGSQTSISTDTILAPDRTLSAALRWIGQSQ